MSEDLAVGEELPDGRMLYRLDSRKSLNLSLADITSNGTIEVFPFVEEKGLLFLQFRRKRLVVSAGPFIGLIPLTPQISIEVRPKLPVTNLSRVLDAAQRSLSILAGTDRLYLTDNLASDSILEFLAINLNDAVRPVLKGGFLKAYKPKSSLGSHPRGKIEVAGTLRAWGRGQHHFLRTSYHEQTSDIPCNRVLKAALQVILRRLDPTNAARKFLIKEMNENFLQFPSTISEIDGRDKHTVYEQISQNLIHSQKSYYYRALEISLMVLSDTGISLQYAGSDVSLASFIVNFEDLFEEYLRRVLQGRSPVEVLVRDGNKEGRRYLFDEKRGQMAQPDIVISAGLGRTVVAEVKYKEKPNRDDINQAITYAICYRTDRVVLVHQKPPDKPSGVYTIGTINGIRLEGFAFDLGALDLEEEEQRFSEALFNLVPALEADVA